MEKKLQKFMDEVALKYHIYNGLFLTLPFVGAEETGTILGQFARFCEQESLENQTPKEILDKFFKKNAGHLGGHSRFDILFKMTQFIERQIVLFDALEDAAFSVTHDLLGTGSLHQLLTNVVNRQHQKQFLDAVANYQVRLILTAHPTQFYPKQVLTILPQLIEAFRNNNLTQIYSLLTQMGQTSFSNKQNPTPFQEAESIVYYLEHTIYPIIPKIQMQLDEAITTFGGKSDCLPLAVLIGFWPGGDRDGNPFVTAQTTLDVARLLKTRIISRYLEDISSLIMKLTFVGVVEKLEAIKEKLHATYIEAFQGKPVSGYSNAGEFKEDLLDIKDELVAAHNSFSVESVDELIAKVRCFGFFFASIDMRENSSIHKDVPESTVDSIRTIKTIQEENGESGLCRYVISNTHSAQDVLELLELLNRYSGFDGSIPVDIIPLFESIEDLEAAEKVMATLYSNRLYLDHLKFRGNRQTVMVGFSDGTKDGGYMAANWAIYKAKMKLTELSQKSGVNVIFFDGRGGPPGRGGGNTHNFYRSLGSKIAHNHPQLTIQGQTIGVTFATEECSKYNIEQFLTAGLEDLIFTDETNNLTTSQMRLLDKMALESRRAYESLKNNPLFMHYLEEVSPLKFFADLHVGSRPVSRKKEDFEFKDLRAIPFVGSWSQIKQNVPGFYGFGTALTSCTLEEIQTLYRTSIFFRTLADNSMMSLLKSSFSLTHYLKDDPTFAPFWKALFEEADRAKKILLAVSNQKELIENDPVVQASIKLREKIVLPLLIIQQSAIIKMRSLNSHISKTYETYKKLILKTIKANTNANRNSS